MQEMVLNVFKNNITMYFYGQAEPIILKR